MTQKALPERVLVLGGTGFMGSEIARAFLAAGSSVTAVARHQPTGRSLASIEGAELVLSDAGDPAALASLVSRVDHVVHAVGAMLPKESNADPVLDATSTLPGILSLLEILRHRPQVGLTYLSSGGTVYGNPVQIPVKETSACDPITSYGIMKLTVEKYIGMYRALYALPARILRVSNAYGPLQPAGRSQGIVGSFLAAARNGVPVRVFGDGTMIRDYVYVADVARAAVDLTRRLDGPRVVNVGSGVGHSVLEVLEIVCEITGRRLVVERLPDRGFDVEEIVLDVGTLSDLASWKPITLEMGIERTWQDLLSQLEPVMIG
jgi:UDP-glucose 4-epimerase